MTIKICSIEGCKSPASARGWCKAHYSRWRRNGDPLVRQPNAMKTHGMWGTRTHHSWHSMISRCINPRETGYKHYGGRGITVCDRWRYSFDNFLADMGERPEGKTLDRIDNEGNYEPGNCRWATWSEQQSNKRPPTAETIEKRRQAWAAKRPELSPVSAIRAEQIRQQGNARNRARYYALKAVRGEEFMAAERERSRRRYWAKKRAKVSA